MTITQLGLFHTTATLLESARNMISVRPSSLIDTGPYILFLSIIIIIFIVLIRTQRLLAQNEQLRTESGFITQLANDKTTFLRLISHFLRPPFASIQSGVAMAQNSSQHTLGNLQAVVYDLHTIVEKIITRIDSDQAVHQIRTEPVWPGKKGETFRNRLFVIPSVILLVCLSTYNIAFLVIAHHPINPLNLIVQAIMFVVVMKLLFSTIHNNVLMRKENERLLALIKFHRQLDSKRSVFAHETQYSLMYAVMKLQESIKVIDNKDYQDHIGQGVQSYNMLLNTFRIVSQLEHTKVMQTNEQASFNTAVADAIKSVLPTIQQKQLNIDVSTDVSSTKPIIQASLLQFTIVSVLQCAISTSLENTRISIDYKQLNNSIAVIITDRGNGTTTQQLRALDTIADHAQDQQTSIQAMDALHLYIARMISHAFRGDLTINGSEGKGTVSTIILPVA